MSAEQAKTCLCPNDPDVERLRELIAGGMGQREASGVLWGAQNASGTDLSAERGATVPECQQDSESAGEPLERADIAERWTA